MRSTEIGERTMPRPNVVLCGIMDLQVLLRSQTEPRINWYGESEQEEEMLPDLSGMEAEIQVPVRYIFADQGPKSLNQRARRSNSFCR